jgi:hypothetical protein
VSIDAINNDSDGSSKRLANWYAAQAATKSFNVGQIAKKVSITTEDSSNPNANPDGDTYIPTQTSSTKLYGKDGKVVTSLTFAESYTKTKFTSDTPPGVTSDMASQLFDSLDQNKDHLLETSEYSKDGGPKPQKTEKTQETEDIS